MKINNPHRALGRVALLLSLALLQACGGSGTSTTTSSTSDGTVSGTVTGFGSVVVDGVEVEDAYARVAHENADGTLTSDVLQMGHRVRVSHDGALKASQVLIDAAVIGKVSAVGTDTLTVAGQVVTVNADSALGPVTVFGTDYTNLASVVVNDLVQVHGTPVYDSTSKKYKVQATRIQKDTGTTRVQVNGKVAGYVSTDTGATFKINDLTVNTTSATAFRPSGSTLTNDVQVTVYGTSLSNGVLTATHVRVNRNQNSGSTSMQAQLSGVVSSFDAAAGSFELQGSTVKVGTVVLQPAGAQMVNNAYVMVKGSVASDGSINASEIRVRTQDTTADLAKVLLIGTISDYVDDSSFVVRGVPVDASSSTLVKNNCPTSFSAYTSTVRVQAIQQTDTAVVVATRIDCQYNSGMKLIKPHEGTVASVNTADQTFSLTLSQGGTQTVQWSDTTTFSGLTAATLEGKSVHVEGYTDTQAVFVARSVRLDDDSASAPKTDDKQFRVRKSGSGQSTAAKSSWTDYRSRKGR